MASARDSRTPDVQPVASRVAGAPVIGLFACAMFVSATLLFMVQPLIAKMVLPRLGGTPAVWNTSVLFFQVALLAGYGYAHLLQRVSGGWQAAIHTALLAVAALVLPLALGEARPPADATPVWWLLWLLTTSAGLPFLALSVTAPLLQAWFSRLPHPASQDPYFLYGASNLGSMAGLLAYPFLVERALALGQQSVAWSVGYAAAASLIVVCAAVAVTQGRRTVIASPVSDAEASGRKGLGEQVTWVVLAFAPSSLMLGVTTHISTDVAAVPLLWVVPLALYLLSFIVAFSPGVRLPWAWLSRGLGVAAVLIVGAAIFGIGGWAFVPLHLLAFFVAAVVLHRALALRRPPPRDLTAFYFLMSVGGALGGAFNSLVAPSLFVTVAEYPLVMVAAAWLRPSPRWRGGRRDDLALAAGVPVTVAAITGAAWAAGVMGPLPFPPLATAFGLVAALLLTGANSPRPSAVALLAVVLVWSTAPRTGTAGVLFAGRSFFGVHQVVTTDDGGAHQLRHGSTLHGWQAVSAMDRCEPATYYHRSGPVGQVFASVGARAERVAVIGLGSGALACYAVAGAHWTFYEIDPMVQRIAEDRRLFTFLANAAATVEVVLGDGRVTLAAAGTGQYDLIVVDAFSSDAVPMHLLTVEFVETARQRLRPGGLLVFNISNRYLDLEPSLSATGGRLGLHSWTWFDGTIDPAQRGEGKTPSRWLLMAEAERPLDTDALAPWRRARVGDRAWSDDFSNLLDAVAWTPAQATGQR